MTTLNKSDLQKFSEQSGLQVDGRSEFAYTDRLEHFSRLVRLDLELEIDDLKDQLAKANQLWQIAQGRCDGLEEKLAKAEQRAEWQPIETAPKDGRELILLLTPSNWPQVAYSNTWWQGGFSVENKPTHWMPLPKAPANTASS